MCSYRDSRSYGAEAGGAYGADYFEWINDQVLVIVQIETAQAIENAEAILAVPGVDGCMIGPTDLALSLGMGLYPHDESQREEHERAIERVLQACRDTGKIPGFAEGSAEGALRRAEQGFRYLWAGFDEGFLEGGALAALEELKQGRSRLRA